MSATDEPIIRDEAPQDDALQEHPTDEHDTLKYHLLGPSLTKAGQDAVDQQKVHGPIFLVRKGRRSMHCTKGCQVSEIIYEASRGSKYFNNEEVKDRNLTERIAKIIAKKEQLSKRDLSSDLRRANKLVEDLELTRDLTQYIVHLDCDAFYAAVEELDRPELKDVPFAVGKGVLTTCNYHARKFGCRSGMAGFVAMKLCPDLICLPLNFDKYIAKAEKVREVVARYDPRFESASIDEAYLNITEYCTAHGLEPEDAVSQLRTDVYARAKITVSAGIAPNAKLAKIGSNRNKPNGQFRVPSDRNAVMEFMHDLPCRKVNGVGRVLERELAEIGIHTCGDIYPQRAYLTKLFGEKAAHFLLQTYLGLGRTKVQPAGSYERKSVGTEGTFRDMSDPKELRDRLMHTAEELEGDLKRTGFKGKTLCLKIKLHTYEVQTRQVVTPYAIYQKDDLYKFALPMLEKLEKEMPGMRLRLMGLRMTHLVSMKKPKDFFGKHATLVKSDSEESTPNASTMVDGDGWEVWPEEEFEAAAQREWQSEMEVMERLSQEHEQLQSSQKKHGRVLNEEMTSPQQSKEIEATLQCPICLVPQPANDREFNDHLDYCLSRQAIKEAVKETAPPTPELSASGRPLTRPASGANTTKRGRPKKSENEADHKGTKKRAFFV